MGLRSAAIQPLAVPGLTTTTVLTTTMTGLAADFALAGGSHPDMRSPPRVDHITLRRRGDWSRAPGVGLGVPLIVAAGCVVRRHLRLHRCVKREVVQICSSGFLQLQTDHRQTAAESAADRRFLFVELALVVSARDVSRTVWGTAALGGEELLNGIRDP